MYFTTRTLPPAKNIALVAHDHCKEFLLNWALSNKETLIKHNLFATGTTGSLIQRALDFPITSMMSGPMGGDQQIGSLISEGKIDMLTQMLRRCFDLRPFGIFLLQRIRQRLTSLSLLPILTNRQISPFRTINVI